MGHVVVWLLLLRRKVPFNHFQACGRFVLPQADPPEGLGYPRLLSPNTGARLVEERGSQLPWVSRRRPSHPAVSPGHLCQAREASQAGPCPRLYCATQNGELSFGFVAKMEKCGINLPCSMVLTSLRSSRSKTDAIKGALSAVGSCELSKQSGAVGPSACLAPACSSSVSHCVRVRAHTSRAGPLPHARGD